MNQSETNGPRPDDGLGGPVMLAVVFFVLSRAAVVLLLPSRVIISDMPVYAEYAIRGVDLRQTPYQGDFRIEYPPVAYWAVALPRLIDQTPYPHGKILAPLPPQLVNRYQRWFWLEMCLFEVGAFFLFLGTVRRLDPSRVTVSAWVFALGGLLLAPVLYDRLDAGLLFFLMLWAYATVRANEKKALGWDLLACAALGLGVGYKWAPVVAVPYFLFGLWRGGPGISQAFAGGVMLGATALFPFLVHQALAGPDVYWFLSFHAERGTEVETIYASLMMALQPFSVEARAVGRPWSWDLAGPWSDRLATISTTLLLGVYAALAVWAWWIRHRFDRGTGFRLGCLALIATATFAKVLSPQYLVWVLPLYVLLGIDRLRDRAFPWFLITLLMLAGLTTWVFPFHFMQVQDPKTGGVLFPTALIQGLGPVREFHSGTAVVLGIRNLGLLVLLGWIGYQVLRRPNAESLVEDAAQ